MRRRLSFVAWLWTQRHRLDPVGDLAWDVGRDRALAKPSLTPSRLAEHLTRMHACEGAHAALASREWTETR